MHNMSQLLCCSFLNRYQGVSNQVSPQGTIINRCLGNLGCWHELPPLKSRSRVSLY